MSEMIDRVATKLKSANETWARAAPMMDGFHMKSVFHFMARAILEEMREPTAAMIDAGQQAGTVFVDGSIDSGGPRSWALPRETIDAAYKSMIDAALT